MNTRTLAFLVVGIILIGAIYGFTKSAPDGADAPLAETERIFEFKIEKGQLTSAPESMKVYQGDKITLAITADAADEMHLHGYDLTLNLKKDSEGKLFFIAKTTGKFELELHHLEIELGALEVLPR